MPTAALAASVVLSLMPLLSPASSKPHFAVLLLPAFLVARLAAIDRGSAIAIGAAITMSVLGLEDLVGERVATISSWAGSTTMIALMLWLGCSRALIRATSRGAL